MEVEVNKNLPEKKHTSVYSLLDEKIKGTNNEKEAINLLTTRTALEQNGTVEKLVAEKTEELENDAIAKRVKAETDRVNEEVKKITAEKEKEIAEFDKVITAKKKEVEELKAQSDKAQAFFDANGEILKYIGIRSKKSLKVMQCLMFPATIIFAVVQILLSPLTLAGIIIETIINIVGGICNSIKNNALKIVVSILVVLLVSGVLIGVYVLGGKLLS